MVRTFDGSGKSGATYRPLCSEVQDVTTYLHNVSKRAESGFSLSSRDTVTTAILAKEKHFVGVAYILRGSVHYLHGAT